MRTSPIEPVDGRIHIEKINAPFLFTLKATGPEFGAGIKYAVEKGWLELHESGTFVRLMSAGAGGELDELTGCGIRIGVGAGLDMFHDASTMLDELECRIV
jgi:hypothetical protein